jgi:EAL domain-containing protein (putative c-di-GMP-specific phosphodiesterase class I)/CheY-like chemotaxis protein
LLVDDEKPVTQSLSRLLKNDFAVIHQAQSGFAALDLLENHNIDMVISDYCMPQMDGAELMTEIDRRYPDILKLMLSGQADMIGFSKALNQGAIQQFICKPWDNRAIKQQIRSIIKQHDATQFSDRLTQLPNLNSLNKEVNNIDMLQWNDAYIAVVSISELSQINRQYGDLVSNQVVKTLAHRIMLAFPEHFIARIDSNQFAILFGDQAKADEHARSIPLVLSQPIHTPDEQIRVKGDISISALVDWEYQRATQVQCGSVEMIAFDSEPNTSMSVDSRLRESCLINAAFINELQDAVAGKQLSVLYQPQVDFTANKVTGCEASFTWHHSTRGVLSAEQFIPLIQPYAMETTILATLLDQIFEFMQRHANWFDSKRMCIDLFAIKLSNPIFVKTLVEKMRHYQIAPQSIELVLNETTWMKNYHMAREQLFILKDLGVSIAINKFGTGFSCYEYLYELPAHAVKIDGYFVENMYRNIQTFTSLKSILDTAKALRLEIVADCVENQKQANFLTEMGCNRLQGDFF